MQFSTPKKASFLVEDESFHPEPQTANPWVNEIMAQYPSVVEIN